MAYLLKGGIVASGYPLEVTRSDVLIEGDLITQVAHSIDPQSNHGIEIIDCSNMLITPGFINGHIHLNQLLNRGFLDNLSTEDLLANMHSRHESKSDNDRYWASLLSIYEGMRSGTTYFSAFATSTGLIAKAMVDAEIRGTITIAKKDQWWGEGKPPAQKKTEEILAGLSREIAAWQPSKIAISIGAASEKAASKPLLQGLSSLANDSGLRIYMHVAEGVESATLSLKYRGCRPVEFLSEIEFLQSNLTIVHASNVTDEEIQLIAKSGASICHCPISNAKTAAGTMPLKKICDAGIGVCLGTDAASTSNTNNILVEGHFTTLLHRALTGQADFPTAEYVFSLLTVEGAKAVGLEGIIGEVLPSFKADLVMWDTRQPVFLPNLNNPVSALIYCASELRPSKIFVAGSLIFDGKPLTFSLEEVYEKVLYYSQHISN